MAVYLDEKEEAERKAAKEARDREYADYQAEVDTNAKARRKAADKKFRDTWYGILFIIFAILIVRWAMG